MERPDHFSHRRYNHHHHHHHHHHIFFHPNSHSSPHHHRHHHHHHVLPHCSLHKHFSQSPNLNLCPNLINPPTQNPQPSVTAPSQYEADQPSPQAQTLHHDDGPEEFEEDEDEDPIFVMTDEWREFFAKSEARRREAKKLAKKQGKK